MMEFLLRLFLYVRKSTDREDKQIHSIDDQIAVLTEFARGHGIEIVRLYQEQRSAKKPGRPVFNEMLEALERGEAQGILAWHPDRLARNAVDGGSILHLLDAKVISHLRFPHYWFENSAQGKLMLNIAFSQAQYQSDTLSENVTRTIDRKFLRGEILHKAPVGYVNRRKTRTAVIHPRTGPLVREMFELYARGEYSLRELRDVMHEKGLRSRSGKCLYLQNIHKILKNPFYLGFVSLRGVLGVGRHEALVSTRLFDRVQATITGRRRRRPRTSHNFVLRGFMRCAECACLITAEKQRGHTYYRCSKRRGPCSQRYAREESLFIQMREIVRRYAADPEWVKFALRELETDRDERQKSIHLSRTPLRERVEQLEDHVSRLFHAYETGALTLGEFRDRKNKLTTEKRRILEEMQQPRDERFELLTDFIRRCGKATELISNGTLSELRTFLENLGSNFTIGDQRLSLRPKPCWKTLTEQGFFELVKPRTASNTSRSRLKRAFVRAGDTSLTLLERVFSAMTDSTEGSAPLMG